MVAHMDNIIEKIAYIDNIDGKHTYSIMHNLNNTFHEALNEEYSL